MLGTLVVAAMEASIISLEVCTAVMMEMKKLLADEANRSEADLARDKFAALQQAFSDALSDPAQVKNGQDLRSIIRANYQRLSAE
jgi:hypothetical protein